jgi:hypothetical protein
MLKQNVMVKSRNIFLGKLNMLSLLQKNYIISIFSTLFLLSSCLSDEQMQKIALASPVEDIVKYPEVLEHLQAHKSFISLTTSPTRIQNLKMVLDTLDLEHIEKIFLVLPKNYRNETGNIYEVPKEIKNFARLEILEISDDLGPLSKLVPSVQKIENDYPDPENIVITIDDDIAYPRGQISGLIKNAILKDAVVSGSGFYVSLNNIRREDWTEPEILSPYCYFGSGRCDIVEAYAGVAYKIKHIRAAGGIAELERLSKLGYPAEKSCFLSDDFVINFALSRAKVARWSISDQFVYRPWLYKIGLGSDGLRTGAGTSGGSSSNWVKYEKCFASFLSKEMHPNSREEQIP